MIRAYAGWLLAAAVTAVACVIPPWRRQLDAAMQDHLDHLED